MDSWRYRALVVAAAALTAAAGCSHRTTETDEQAPPPAASSTTAASPTLPGAAPADALPAEFPADVPIVAGDIDADSRDVLGSLGKIWMVTVTGLVPADQDAAERLLTDAGFDPIEDTSEWSGGPCAREAQFRKEDADTGAYIVHLCGNPDADHYRLEYTVNVYPKGGWGLPEIPDIPAPPEPPAPPR